MNHSHVIVAVAAENTAKVTQLVQVAATFAERFDAELVCANVNPSRYTIDYRSDQTVVTMSIDADRSGERVEEFDTALAEAIATALKDSPVPWSLRALAGGTSQELGRLAHRIDAAMIIVGTKEPGIQGSLHELINGSVAVSLAHHQHRPVVVVPLAAEHAA